MDILYRDGKATAAAIQESLPSPPSYSAVRAMLRILETKGHVRHEQDGARYVFIPTMRRERAKRSALRHIVDTFFEGSAPQMMTALFEMSVQDLSETELQRLRSMIDAVRKERK